LSQIDLDAVTTHAGEVDRIELTGLTVEVVGLNNPGHPEEVLCRFDVPLRIRSFAGGTGERGSISSGYRRGSAKRSFFRRRQASSAKRPPCPSCTPRPVETTKIASLSVQRGAFTTDR